jgi:hypothetical protein
MAGNRSRYFLITAHCVPVSDSSRRFLGDEKMRRWLFLIITTYGLLVSARNQSVFDDAGVTGVGFDCLLRNRNSLTLCYKRILNGSQSNEEIRLISIKDIRSNVPTVRICNRETNAINNANKSSCGRKTITLKEILTIYANLTKKMVLIGPQIPSITVEYAPEEMLSRDDAAKYIEATLFEHGIVVEAFGSKYVNVLRKEGLRSGSLHESIQMEIIKPSELETE